MHLRVKCAFTLIEILIVVIILGILAAVAVPQMSSAVSESSVSATSRELQKLREHIEIYRANNLVFPAVVAGDGTWGQLISSDHLMSAPINAWVGSPNGRVITIGAAPDGAFQSAHGWIFNPANGEVFAGSFDGDDQPINP